MKKKPHYARLFPFHILLLLCFYDVDGRFKSMLYFPLTRLPALDRDINTVSTYDIMLIKLFAIRRYFNRKERKLCINTWYNITTLTFKLKVTAFFLLVLIL